MLQAVRYAKTPAGMEEISARRTNLRGKLRTMLILVDPSKAEAELRSQAAQIGAPADFLESLLAGGYVAPLGAMRPADTVAANDAPAPDVSTDELSRFRDAKSFMNETVVGALGIRAFMFTLRLERCATRADLGQLLPDYERAMRKGTSEPEARALAEQARVMIGMAEAEPA